MTTAAPRPFELVPRRRFVGAPFGRRRSARRGQGDELAGTRPYRPGDPRGHIHWPASARLSAARGSDEFVVREFYADEAPRVLIACDRRPGMAIHAGTPWLDKRQAAETVVRLIAASAAAEHADVGFADGMAGRPHWVAVGSHDRHLPARISQTLDAPEQSLRLALDALFRESAAAPPGSFVFLVSDFIVPVPAALWLRLRSLGWDVVPVVVQDPLWEQTFPQIDGVVLPIAEAGSGRVDDVWIGRRDARARAEANERRLADSLARFRRLGFDPVVVDTVDGFEISRRFEAWAARRRLLRSARP
jgi:uncharacterized protein (DUF58 family)